MQHDVHPKPEERLPKYDLLGVTDVPILKDSGERRQFRTGAVRDRAVGKGRFDLIPTQMMFRLARHYEAGAIKYSKPIELELDTSSVLSFVQEELETCQTTVQITQLDLYTQRAYADPATKRNSEQITLSSLNGNERTGSNGEKRKPTKRKSWHITNVDGLTHNSENETQRQSDEAGLDFSDLAKKQTVYYWRNKKVSAEYAARNFENAPVILTMHMLNKGQGVEGQQEVIYVMAATELSGCWETLLKVCKELCPTFKILQLTSSPNGKYTAQIDNSRNWEKGMEFSVYVDAALRHLTKYIAGWNDEDHLAAAIWNLAALMFQEEKNPDLQDLPERQLSTPRWVVRKPEDA